MLVPCNNNNDSPVVQIKLGVFGSTGSIGESTLEIVRSYPSKFKVTALVAGSNYKKLAQQIKEFKPEYVGINSEEAGRNLLSELNGTCPGIKLFAQNTSAEIIADQADYDLMVAGIVGIAGLKSVYAAAGKGKTIALANKESLVCGGQVLAKHLKKNNSSILPVDSEHSAIWQCLLGNNRSDVASIILTASGGPFFSYTSEQISTITKAQALKHPRWSMGAKVTIDSSTLFNKALEIIEAKWLFNLNAQQIETVIHPESIVHSMVRYCDGSVLMQASVPDMKQAIGFALSFPYGRLADMVPNIDFYQLEKLHFYKPDSEKFRSIKLVYDAIGKEDSTAACVVFNAANEIAVDKFLKDQINWPQIYPLVEQIYSKFCDSRVTGLDDIIELDKTIKAYK